MTNLKTILDLDSKAELTMIIVNTNDDLTEWSTDWILESNRQKWCKANDVKYKLLYDKTIPFDISNARIKFNNEKNRLLYEMKWR